MSMDSAERSVQQGCSLILLWRCSFQQTNKQDQFLYFHGFPEKLWMPLTQPSPVMSPVRWFCSRRWTVQKEVCSNLLLLLFLREWDLFLYGFYQIDTIIAFICMGLCELRGIWLCIARVLSFCWYLLYRVVDILVSIALFFLCCWCSIVYCIGDIVLLAFDYPRTPWRRY